MHEKPDEMTWTEYYEWPECAIPGCENKSCLRLNSPNCHPHTGIGESYEEMMSKLKDKEIAGV